MFSNNFLLCYGELHMKKIIITYSNGDRQRSIYTGSNLDEDIQDLIASAFKIPWFSKDSNGNYATITNMDHVRFVEIIDEKEDWID